MKGVCCNLLAYSFPGPATISLRKYFRLKKGGRLMRKGIILLGRKFLLYNYWQHI